MTNKKCPNYAYIQNDSTGEPVIKMENRAINPKGHFQTKKMITRLPNSIHCKVHSGDIVLLKQKKQNKNFRTFSIIKKKRESNTSTNT